VDNKAFRILALAGSLRQGSYNRGLLRAAEELAPDWVKVQFFDIGTLPSSTRISSIPQILRLFASSSRP
jgi:hypothetical protein